MTKINIDNTQTLDIAMAKRLGSIQRNGLHIYLHSGEEIFVCFSSKKIIYITDPKEVKELGQWLIRASEIMAKEEREKKKK